MIYKEDDFLVELTIGDILILEDKSEHEVVADCEDSETCESCSLNEFCDTHYSLYDIGCQTDAFHFIKVK
jgi:positive regulator of sigma E activity